LSKTLGKQQSVTTSLYIYYIKHGKVSAVTMGVASSVANDVIMGIACFVAAGTGRTYGKWRHSLASAANDMMMRMTS